MNPKTSIAAAITAVAVALTPLAGVNAGIGSAAIAAPETAREIRATATGLAPIPGVVIPRPWVSANSLIVFDALRDVGVTEAPISDSTRVGISVREVLRTVFAGVDEDVLFSSWPKDLPTLPALISTGHYGTATLMIGAAADQIRRLTQPVQGPTVKAAFASLPTASEVLLTRAGQVFIAGLNLIGLPWQVVTAAGGAGARILASLPEVFAAESAAARWDVFNAKVNQVGDELRTTIDRSVADSIGALRNSVNAPDPSTFGRVSPVRSAAEPSALPALASVAELPALPLPQPRSARAADTAGTADTGSAAPVTGAAVTGAVVAGGAAGSGGAAAPGAAAGGGVVETSASSPVVAASTAGEVVEADSSAGPAGANASASGGSEEVSGGSGAPASDSVTTAPAAE
ncbi:hypothetical protein GCM10027289_20720 [Tsukamurella serpentis]